MKEIISWEGDDIKAISSSYDNPYRNSDRKYGGESIEGFDSAAYVDKYEIDYYAHSGDFDDEELETMPDEERYGLWWRVHLARPGENFGYVVKLDARHFTKEDAINLAKTLKF